MKRNHFTRLYVKIIKKFQVKTKELVLNDFQKIAFDIFKQYLYNKKAEVMMSSEHTTDHFTNSNKRFIFIGDKTNPEVCIIISFPSIKIINHTYFYNIDLTMDLYKKMIDMHDRKLKSERIKMESAIDKNIIATLEKISSQKHD